MKLERFLDNFIKSILWIDHLIPNFAKAIEEIHP